MTNATDVGAIIARAAELKHASEESLTPEQVREVAAELGIEGHFVDAAVKDLARRQETKKKEAAARALAAKARRKKIIGGVLAFDALLFGALGFAWYSADHAVTRVTLTEAAVKAAIVRQHETEALFASKKGEREADAELAGAQNRVALAKKSYDAAAIAFNTRDPFTRIGALFVQSPEKVPLSTERAW